MGNICRNSGVGNPAIVPKCKCGNRLDENSMQICEDHQSCKNCALNSLGMNRCQGCTRVLKYDDKEKIKEKYTSKCKSCKLEDWIFKKQTCGCEVCHICFENNSSGTKCSLCSHIFKKEPVLTSSHLTCPICTMEKEMKSLMFLECKHYFDPECLKSHISYEIESNQVEICKNRGVTCPACPQLISDHLLSNMLSKTLMQKLTLILNPDIIECPGCKLLFIPLTKMFICSCGSSFCVECKRESKKCVCDSNDDFILTEDMSCCPGCKSAYLKDEKCDHVKCENTKCGVEFCFQCSAYRDPTLKHGNHYHRPSCRFYSSYTGSDIYKSDCSRCKLFKKLCERPKDLRNCRRFGNGEN